MADNQTPWTPGPWQFKSLTVWASRSAASVAGVYSGRAPKPSVEERVANGHLISAAPDLAEALEALLPNRLGYGNSFDHEAYARAVVVARAALSKAKGEA